MQMRLPLNSLKLLTPKSQASTLLILLSRARGENRRWKSSQSAWEETTFTLLICSAPFYTEH